MGGLYFVIDFVVGYNTFIPLLFCWESVLIVSFGKAWEVL